MSRILLGAFLFLPATAVAEPEAIANYEALTRVEPRCTAPAGGREIVVCGRRKADRWRVPYLTKAPGDPAIQDVSGERNGLIATTTPCEDHSIFLVGCGSGVGVRAKVGFGPGGGAVQLRPLAD